MKITEKDRLRLAQHLTGWNKLNELFVLNGITVEDLRMMIVIEATGCKRKGILTKLVSRLYSTLRKQTLESIDQCLLPLKNTLKPRLASGAKPTASSTTSSQALPDVASRIELPSLQVVELASLSSNARAANRRPSSAKKS